MSDDRWARAALSRLVEPCDARVHTLVEKVGPPEAVERICGGAGWLARFGARVRTLDTGRDLEVASRVGARLIVPSDPEWPSRLDDLAMPPWCLWVRGPVPLDLSLRRSVAVVGARMATTYGEQLAAELSAGLADRGWTVVSGAAFGIDGAAHRGALAVEGTTVAVLASGVDRPYPVAHTTLLRRIAETGAVVSEVAPGCAPLKSRFLHRNRLIAAMTRGTVVVEAGLRSGSRNTVTHATDLCRPVGAVPGPVTSMASAGCHQEVRDGRAELVTSAAEVIDLVGDIGADAVMPARGPVAQTDSLGPHDAAVYEALPYRDSLGLDGLAALTTLAPLAVRSALARLEQAGLAVSRDGEWKKARRKAAS